MVDIMNKEIERMYSKFNSVGIIAQDLDKLECEINNLRKVHPSMFEVEEWRCVIDNVRREYLQKFQEKTSRDIYTACKMVADGSFDEEFNKDVLEAMNYLSRLNLIECALREVYAGIV